ncbi:MAG: winged helix-turn-helix domain-containing protein [Pseudomonadota bacterium]
MQDAADASDTTPHGTFVFGTHRVDLNTYELFAGNEVVSVEPQVFSLLSYLITHRDRVVSKEELLDELWGHRYVSDAALSTQIKSLRRAVADDGQRQAVIQTVRGRGYRFVAPIEEATRKAREPAAPRRAAASNLPRERTPLFGRQADVEQCLERIAENRLVSVLGIGGTGKTRLAARVGRDALTRFQDGVWFIDLIPLTSVEALETAIADVLGMALAAEATRPQLIDALKHRDVLLILDNCEHLRASVADLVNDLLEYTVQPRFLTTSRDPLGLIDEYQYFLNPLVTAVNSGVSPAAQLFAATASRHGVEVHGDQDSAVEGVCTQLDGLPLAIELAAAQLRHLTLEELRQRLHKRFEVLAGRERTVSGRQRNLLGVLKDTWEMLDGFEQILLGQLATFPSRFTMTAVEEVHSDTRGQEISAAISRLVDLGLIQRTASRGVWWRVLETVREFAVRDLSATDKAANAERHARWALRKLGRFPDDQLDNLKQAEWCMDHYADLDAAEQHFAQTGELEHAYALCAGTGLMVQLDDGARAKDRLERAEQYLDGAPSSYWQARLHAIAGLSAQANRLPELLNHHNEAYLELARQEGDPELLANALLMQSLTTGFIDPELAFTQLDEMIALGQAAANASLVESGTCYRAWQHVMGREYHRGQEQAEQLVARFDSAPSAIDNSAYNCIGIIITCTVVDKPALAASWAARLEEFPAVLNFWGIQNLLACVEASTEDFRAAARRCLDIKARLNLAARDEFPDVLVTATLLAYRQGDSSRVQRWLAAIRWSRIPIQMYHTIAIYRMLYEALGFGDFDQESSPSLDEVRADAVAWLGALAES